MLVGVYRCYWLPVEDMYNIININLYEYCNVLIECIVNLPNELGVVVGKAWVGQTSSFNLTTIVCSKSKLATEK